MSTTVFPPSAREMPAAMPVSTDAAMPQYTRRKVFGIWAAAAIPMGTLAWVVAPFVRDHIGGRDPFIEAVLMCFTAGLLWVLALALILVRRERGTLRGARGAMWLRAPRDPKTGRRGGKVWWMAVPFVFLSALLNGLPIDPVGPMPRDLPHLIDTDRAEAFFHGNWLWFAMVVVVAMLAPIVEELLFRGVLLPRMRAACGKGDVAVNGAMFGLYHLHQPWSMPAAIIDGIVAQAYPTKRYRSTWMGLITHTVPSFVIIGVVLSLVI
jgi:membrane protease YdiL (CAAX protease family)